MLIFQIIAALFLIPLTILMLVLFNVYLIHGVYWLFFLFFVFIYSLLCGLLFLSWNAAGWLFTFLLALYVARIIYLACYLHDRTNLKKHPILRAHISIKKYKINVCAFFPLIFLNILKLFPARISQRLSKEAGMDIQIAKLVDLILYCSLGTKVEVVTNEIGMDFEIQ